MAVPEFQSTAGPETGRSAITPPQSCGSKTVSIHGRPGDRPLLSSLAAARLFSRVSIHGRPGDRPLHQRRGFCDDRNRVSIHGRPGDRPLRVGRSAAARDAEFQSTAGPETGRSVRELVHLTGRLLVSIHGRPGDRPLPATVDPRPRAPGRFNPRPARRPAAPSTQ